MQDGPPAGTPLVLFNEIEPGIAILTLNRPQARNALSRALIDELTTRVESLSRNDAIAAIIVAAEGKVFSSGHDLKEITSHRRDSDGGRAFFTRLMEQCASLMRSVVDHDKPVIAEVQGIASAAGCQLVSSCDLAVASETASFCTPGVNIGLFCSTPMVALSRNVARKHAMGMLLTGDVIAADEALRIGLVNRVVPAADLLAEARTLAAQLAASAPIAMRYIINAVNKGLEMPFAEACQYEATLFGLVASTEDMREGTAAFLEKRKAAFKGK